MRNYNLYSLLGSLLSVGDLENKEVIGLNYDYNWGLEYGWGCRRIDCFVVKGLVNGMDCCMDCCYRFFPSSFLIFWEKGNILEKKEKKQKAGMICYLGLKEKDVVVCVL